MMTSLNFHLISPFSPLSKTHSPSSSSPRTPPPTSPLPLVNTKPLLLSLAVAVAVGAAVVTLSAPLPSLAVPSLNSQPSLIPPPPTTPFSQSKNLATGLQNGYLPNRIFLHLLLMGKSGRVRRLTLAVFRVIPNLPLLRSHGRFLMLLNPMPFRFEILFSVRRGDELIFEILIPTLPYPLQQLKEAIMNTQKNAKIQVVEDTPYGQYLQAEVDDGGFGRDVLEFLVKGDVVSYRSMATKVTYVYPFTTAFGDSKGQQQRLKKILDNLGWFAPTFDAMD